jgi:hypothetical protein
MAGVRGQMAAAQGDEANLKSMAITAGPVAEFLEAGDLEGARGHLTSKRDQYKRLNLDTKSIDEGLSLLDQNPELLRQRAVGIMNAFNSIGKGKSNIPAGLAEFEGMTKGLSPEDRERARRIDLGLDPRAMGSSAITTATQGLTDQVAKSEATIAGTKTGASETAKLGAQLDLLPEVKAAVTGAQERIKNEVELEATAKKNSIALDMYNAATKSLEKALQGIETGPVAGRLPAVTAKQQTAEGAVAAVAPILKSLFRTAGEGTFTDKDQELLTNMLPTRKDHPETIKAKLQNINAIVRAKLNSGSNPSKFQIEVVE